MEQFKVGIILELQDRFSAGLKSVSSALHGAHTQLAGLNTAAGKLQALQGSFSQIAMMGKSMANFGFGGLSEIIEPTKEYNHQLNLMNMAGLKQIEIQKNIDAAWKATTAVPTSTAAGNLAALADMRSVLTGKHSLDEARELLPFLQKAQTALSASMMHLGGHSSHDAVFSAVKAVEMMGRPLNSEQMQYQLNEMIRTGVASNGRVMPEHYQQMLKYARQSKMTLSNDFLYNKAPELMIEYQNSGGKGGGGGGIGAMLAAGSRQVVMGVLNKVAAGNLQQLGLLNHPVLKTTTTGTRVTGYEGVKGASTFASDPSNWVEKFLIPALERKNPQIKGDANAVNMAIAQTFKGNQLAISLYQDLHNKIAAMTKFRQNRAQVGGVESSFKKALNDPEQGVKAFEAQMLNLKTVLGKDVLPVVVPGLVAFAHGLSQVAQYIKANPAIGQAAVGLMAGLGVVGSAISSIGGLLGTGLALKLLGLSRPLLLFTGWIGVATGAVTLITVAIMNWDKVTQVFNNAIVGIKGLMLDLGDRFPQIKGAMSYLVDTLRAWKDAMPGLTSSIQSFVNMIGGMANRFAGSLGAYLFNPVANANSVNARWNQEFGHSSKTNVHNNTPQFHTTINVHGGDADLKKTKKAVMEMMNDAFAHASASHPLAGGNRISYAHAGEH